MICGHEKKLSRPPLQITVISHLVVKYFARCSTLRSWGLPDIKLFNILFTTPRQGEQERTEGKKKPVIVSLYNQFFTFFTLKHVNFHSFHTCKNRKIKQGRYLRSRFSPELHCIERELKKVLKNWQKVTERSISGFSRFPAKDNLRRTSLHLSLSSKIHFYLPAFEISRSCRTASYERTPARVRWFCQKYSSLNWNKQICLLFSPSFLLLISGLLSREPFEF